MGEFFPGGTILSVPSYSIHRDPKIWGEDFETYRPERWFEGDQAAMNKAFNPYSVGPRYVAYFPLSVYCSFLTLFCSACVGRNLAAMELQIIIASIMRRFDLVLEKPGQKVSRASCAERAFQN